MSLAAAIASSSSRKRLHRRDRPEDLLVEHARARRDRRRAPWARRSSPARRRGAPPHRTVGAAAPARPRRAPRPCRARSRRSADPTSTPASRAMADLQRAHPLGEAAGELLRDGLVRRRSGWPRCRPRRRCASWRASRRRPRRRGRRPRRRGTARCRRAPSTCAGAARRPARRASRPTSVEPVNDSLRMRGSEISGSTTLDADELVITLSTPAGSPRALEDLRQREHRQRRLLRGLDDHRAARRDGGADLARAHRHREVPGRDQQARADRLLHHEQAAAAVGRGREAAVDAHRLLGEPAEELGRVGDLRRATRRSGLPISSVISSASSSRRSISSS